MVTDICQCPGCYRIVKRPKDAKIWFCSIGCACYAGEFSVSKGWKNKEKSNSQ